MSPPTSLLTAVKPAKVCKTSLFSLFIWHSVNVANHSDYIVGDISIGIKCAPGVMGPAEADIDFDIIKNDNDTFTVKYTPPGPGRYTIMVLLQIR